MGLPTEVSPDKRIGVKFLASSVPILVALSLCLAPLHGLLALGECDMFGVSSTQMANCDGCCAEMRCCPEPYLNGKSHPVQPGSNSRSASGCDNPLALAPGPCIRLHALPIERKISYSSRSVSVSREFPSLERLCIRLI